MTVRTLRSYGLTAGLRYDDMDNLSPGEILDLFIMRRKYDDNQHRIQRG